MISDQLSLTLTLDDSALFSNYIIAQENKLAVAALKSLAEPDRGRVEDFIYLWGYISMVNFAHSFKGIALPVH